jgi:hypothetical protein
MLKHIGRLKKSQRRVIVAYRTLPGDSNSCVVVTTENLESADHDSLIQLVESNAGQNSYEFAQVMARGTLSDGSNMLARFHTTGKMIKVPTSEVEMTPDTNTKLMLDELNKIIAQQKGVTVDDLALDEKNQEPTTRKNINKDTPDPTANVVATENDVLTDEQLAANYRSQADRLFKEAKQLREQAEALHPIKKRSTVKKTKETI